MEIIDLLRRTDSQTAIPILLIWILLKMHRRSVRSDVSKELARLSSSINQQLSNKGDKMSEVDMKKAALNIAEETIKQVISQVVRPYAEIYIMKSETKVDDILLPFLDDLEKALLSVVDKIDQEPG